MLINSKEKARSEIFAAIRKSLAASAPFDALHKQHHSQVETALNSNAQVVSTLERFKTSLEAVMGNCIVVKNENEATEQVQEIFEKLEVKRIAISDSILVERVMSGAKTNAEVLKNADKMDLFNCDVGVTEAQGAIAETGTLVIESNKERNRLCSLVPTFHIAIIEARKIRDCLGEVLEAINENGKENLSRTITFITGPSRTSDIELTLAIGVHGPAELYVIVIDGERE